MFQARIRCLKQGMRIHAIAGIEGKANAGRGCNALASYIN
jgi:hypothetical protein